MRLKLRMSLGILALSAVMLSAAIAGVGASASAPVGKITNGGTFRTASSDGTFRITVFARNFGSIDPALSASASSGALLDATCARLFNYPDKPSPEVFRVIPEVAAGKPDVSRDYKKYTFTLRKEFRFSETKAPVRASAFVRAIDRALSPGMGSPGAPYLESIVGAKDVQAGRAITPRGVSVSADGLRLVIRFTRATPDFTLRTTMPFMCAVPPTLPIDPEGEPTFDAAGPYYVAQNVLGRRVVLKRNTYYHGRRPHRVKSFVVDFVADPNEVLDRIERGEADWGWAPPTFYFDPARKLAQKYGKNKKQFFIKPGLTFKYFALNTSRGIFHNNPKLRRAVNYAVDRGALMRAAGGRPAVEPTDQYLPFGFPGFRNADIYPLGQPNLALARRLAKGHLGSGKAVLYVIDVPGEVLLAQTLKQNLAKIDLDVEITRIPGGAYFNRIVERGEPFDIAWGAFGADYLDPYTYINTLLGGSYIGTSNYSRFNSSKYNRQMDRAAGLQGKKRSDAYGDLDIALARKAAPLVAYAFANEPTLVSKRVGCRVLRPSLDLAAACLK